MSVFVGTSGYSYAPWKGVFYPPKLPAAKMLSFYASRFRTVELNSTFYRMPKTEVFEQWRGEVPPGFVFAVKSPKRITHVRRLADVDDALAHLLAGARALGASLGPMLFQLPPLMRKDLPRLESFLAALRARAPEARPALEFRHASWFEPDVFGVLERHGAALCVAEADELATPLVATATWGYLRLRRAEYTERELVAWAERIAAQPWRETFVFFKHEDEGEGPRFAERLQALTQA